MCVCHGETTVLAAFQALRLACRAQVRSRAALGAALLFSGSRTMVLLEGPRQDLRATADSLIEAVGRKAVTCWADTPPAASARLLPPGQCQLGYLEDDLADDGLCSGRAEAPDRIQAFMAALAASDHD